MDYSWIGPAVTASIITAVITLFTSHRNHALNYITSERSPWRLRIKAAIQDLLIAFGDSSATELALQKVKSELNPYGRFAINFEATPSSQSTPKKGTKEKEAKKTEDNAQYYLRDGHIWNAIANYENAPTNRESLSALIVFLELLLKFDWERSKREVAGFSTFLSTVTLCILGAVTFSLTTTNETDPWKIGGYAMVIIAISLLFILVPPYCLFKSSASCVPSNLRITLSSIFVMAPASISYSLFFLNWQRFSMLVASLALFLSATFSISTHGKRDIERKYIYAIKKAIKKNSLQGATPSSDEEAASSIPSSPSA